nr:shikimate kinase 2 [Leucojum aestivum]
MEMSASLSSNSCSLIGGVKSGRKSCGILRVSRCFDEERRIQSVNLRGSSLNSCLVRTNGRQLRISCCYKKSGDSHTRVCGECALAQRSFLAMSARLAFIFASAGDSPNFHSSVDEARIVKRKSEDVLPYLNGRCVYLVGMMGSGKTTVGKILSEVLGYSFFDSDKLVEEAVGMPSVAQIFKERSEAFFRDSESEVLKDLSSMQRLVVATGGGAVIRPVNWRYMKHGITVWLDVPLEALARRISAVGTASRPLLNHESGDPYEKAFERLSMLSEERGEAYANADARVCLQNIADKQGHANVSLLTPMAIATEVLVKIESFLTAEVPAERFSHHQGRIAMKMTRKMMKNE